MADGCNWILMISCLDCSVFFWIFDLVCIVSARQRCDFPIQLRLVWLGGDVCAYGSISVRGKTRCLELGLGGGGNNVLVTTLLMLRCQLGEVTSKTLWMPWCWHVEVMSTSIVAVVAVAATLAVEVWKCQWGPVQKDRENHETNVSRPAVWKDMHCIFCRVGTMLEQIKFPLSVNVVFTGFWAKMDEFESTLFWSALVFPRRAQQSFFLVFTVFFSMSSFQTC